MPESKQCSSCLKVLSTSHFYKDSDTFDKLKNKCKPCARARIPAVIRRPKPKTAILPFNKRRRLACNKYEKTLKGKLMRTHRNMQNRVEGKIKECAHLYKGLYLLPIEEFYAWALNDPTYLLLHKNWVDSGYKIKLGPSIDRLDSNKGYEKGNMQWLTQSQNSRETTQWRFSQGISTTA